MAKTKPKDKPKGKGSKTVSTSGIFRKGAIKDIQSPDRRPRLTSLKLPSARRHRHSRKRTPDHSLAVAFSETVEASRQSIAEQVLSDLQAVHQELAAEADKIGERAQEQMQAIVQKSNDILKPLDDEMLELVRKDGTVITVSLKERLDFYRRLTAKEEKSRLELSRELAKVQKQIDDFTVQVFGAAGVKMLRQAQDGQIPAIENAEQKQIQEEIEREQKSCLDAIAKLGEEAIDEMMAAEKELKIKHRQRIQQFYSLFDDED